MVGATIQVAPRMLPPPQPPHDLVTSALHLHLQSISPLHRGRKIRTVGQVLEFDVSTSLLLLSSHSANTHSTLLVDISITLLGNNPSITDRSHTDFFASDNEKISNGPTNREPLRLHRGEWVCVVGWLEGEGSGIVKKINLPDNYDSPIPIILECIYIVPSRAPLQNGLVRGEITPWDGTRQVDGPAVDQEEDTTPRPRKKR